MEHVFDDGFAVERSSAMSGERRVRVETVDAPAALRGLGVDELIELAADVRRFLIGYAADKGGHFAPSMGTVELTLALHHVFKTPEDLLVWDTGHQAYVHKLLTGRRDQFPTLRRYGGLSGFLKRDESPFDTFGAGHASTAVSAAFGMATARDLQGRNPGQRVVAIIGDGAMTGGLAFEALNNAGASGRDLLVVLNDNAMSISPNVGAVAHYLTSLTTHPYYRRMKSDIATVLGKLPRVAQPVGEIARRTMRGVKTALVPGALFEAFGFNYIGPIDGHDMAELVDVLGRIKTQYRGPVLLHVLTHKGKGYAPAEADPLAWHGVTPFDPATGRTIAASKAEPRPLAPPSYTAAFGAALVDLARRHADVVAITAAMCPGTGLSAFQDAYPDRFFDVGIAEGHGVTFAAGLTTQGTRPVCAIYSTFLQRAFDNIVHDIALQHLPVVFALDRAGLAGADGPTHHGAFDLSYMRLIPDMVVSAPKDADELADLLETAHAHTDGPFSIRYPRDDSPTARTRAPRILPLGSWEVLEQEGPSAAGGAAHGHGAADAGGAVPARGATVVLLAVGTMIPVAQAAARLLLEQGHVPMVVNARFVKPLDIDLLRALAPPARVIVTLEENTLRGGFGSAVHEAGVEHDLGLSGRLLHVGLPDRFVTHGSRKELLEEVGLTGPAVAAQILAALSRASAG